MNRSPHAAMRRMGPRQRAVLCGMLAMALGPALTAQGDLRLSSIHNLLQGRTSVPLVLLRGTVTYNGGETIVQDGSGALAVERSALTSISSGDEVEVKGRLEMRSGIPIVREADVRRLWSGSMPLPLAISPDEAAEGAYNGMLVESEGKLIKADTGGTGTVRLTLDGGTQLFTCVLERRPPIATIRYETGATLRCMGVLFVEQRPSSLGAGTFQILLRSGMDLRQLQAAPWWTPRHLQMLFALFVLLLWAAYRIHLRNMQARLALVLEERTRIAREIHDTLAQGFAGIALQLQALTRTMGEQSAASEAHLAMALLMVRRSRAEAHRSIATLRTLHSCENLTAVSERLLRQLTEPAGIALTVLEVGMPRPLPDEVASQLIRIAQEAIANTVEHAHARHVTVTIQYCSAALTMEIRDDGHGFDLANARSLDTGHFGITGMYERAEGIHSRLAIQSSESGTVLRIEVPLAPRLRSRRGLMLRAPRQAAGHR